jgi:hypothetical protein
MTIEKIKMIALICLFLVLVGVGYAGTCFYTCVHCGISIVAGCNMPPKSNGYCVKSPNTQHIFVPTN